MDAEAAAADVDVDALRQADLDAGVGRPEEGGDDPVGGAALEAGADEEGDSPDVVARPQAPVGAEREALEAALRAAQVGAFDVTADPCAEAELAVVIGVGGKNISREAAMSHVYGYTIVNDVTARDVQMRHQQWDMGKSFDTFCPMGPWLVSADEMDGRETRVRCWVNGELRQDAPTANMIFDIPTLIETVSRGITLYPGDVIATGTPAGVGMGFKPPRYLRDGDTVRIEIDGIGSIENQFAGGA